MPESNWRGEGEETNAEATETVDFHLEVKVMDHYIPVCFACGTGAGGESHTKRLRWRSKRRRIRESREHKFYQNVM